MADVVADEDSNKRSADDPITIPDEDDDDAAAVPNSNPGGESSSSSLSPPATDVGLGGKRQENSFCLLDGVFRDPETNEEERVSIDITRLPALLGRSNDSDKDNPHFFGLGKKKALSRKHCTIYYRDTEGGQAEWDEAKQALVYKNPSTILKENGKQSPPKPNPLLAENETEHENGLPPHGFFVIECLGKNRILVDRTRIEQGESMVLRSGSAIRISAYLLYFLLPTDAEPKPHTILSAGTKKKTKEVSKVSSSKKRPVPVASSSSTKKSKKAPATLAELETLPVDELLERMDDAVSKGLWDRRNQFIGATICYHAVRSAGAAPEIQRKVFEDGGVSRSDIMEWIEESDKYGGWVSQMLTNMEPRSYQAAVTKALLKSGFARTSGAGRYIKWSLPDDIPLRTKKKKKAAAKPKPKPIKKQEEEEEEEAADSEPEEEEEEEEEEEDDGDSDQPPEETPDNDEDEEEEEASADGEDGEEESGDDNEDEKEDKNEDKNEDENEDKCWI